MPHPRQRRRTPLAPLVPPRVPGLKAWYAADNSSQSDTPYADGASVTRWRDLSTACRNDTGTNIQSNPSTAPVFKTGIVNGRPVVRFAGSPVRLDTSGFVVAQGGYTLFVVSIRTGASPLYALIDADGGAAPRTFGMAHANTTQDRITGVSTAIVTNNVSVTGTNSAWHVTSGSYDGQTIACYFNGSAWARTSLADTPNSGTHDLGLGGSTVGTDFLVGDIAEVLVYNPALPEFLRQRVEQYLGRKYLIQVSR